MALFKKFTDYVKSRSSEWRDFRTSNDDFDRFLTLPSKVQIFQQLSKLGLPSGYDSGRKLEPIYQPLKEEYPELGEINVYELNQAHQESVRFKGDFQAFVNALQNPLFVSYEYSLAKAMTHLASYEYSPESVAIMKQVKEPDRIPENFFEKAIYILQNEQNWDDRQIVEFFNQPLQQQLSQIKSIITQKAQDRGWPKENPRLFKPKGAGKHL